VFPKRRGRSSRRTTAKSPHQFTAEMFQLVLGRTTIPTHPLGKRPPTYWPEKLEPPKGQQVASKLLLSVKITSKCRLPRKRAPDKEWRSGATACQKAARMGGSRGRKRIYGANWRGVLARNWLHLAPICQLSLPRWWQQPCTRASEVGSFGLVGLPISPRRAAMCRRPILPLIWLIGARTVWLPG
jgi:hypothetical protein